jgi:hypothetical protein
MTISFRLFGYSVCFTIAKLIRIPPDRLDLCLPETPGTQ